MRIARLLLPCVGTVALAGTAAAEGEDSSARSEADAKTPDPGSAPDDAKLDARYPRAAIDRPLTLPKGVAMPGLDLRTRTAEFFDPATVRVVFGYGVTDHLELGFLQYKFPSDGGADGSIDLNLAYRIANGASNGKLEAVLRLQGGYAFAGTRNLTTNMTEGAVQPLQLGVQVRYRLTSKLAVHTLGESPLLTGRAPAPAGLGVTPDATERLRGQLSIGLTEPFAITFDVPVGLGYQATPQLYLQLDTLIAHIGIKDDDSEFMFSDTLPINLLGIYSVKPEIDILAGILFDASADSLGDTLEIVVGGRYYFGL